MYRFRFTLLLLFILATFASLSAYAQEVEDTIKIKTRVVFLDALVKDKKTSLPISNLASENFQVLDNGKPRDISYFTREGQARQLAEAGSIKLAVIEDQDFKGDFTKYRTSLNDALNATWMP